MRIISLFCNSSTVTVTNFKLRKVKTDARGRPNLQLCGGMMFGKKIDLTADRNLMTNHRERLMSKQALENLDLGAYQAKIDSALNRLYTEDIVKRIWKYDYTVWKPNPEEITNRLDGFT